MDLPDVAALPALARLRHLRRLRLPREADGATLAALADLAAVRDRLRGLDVAGGAVVDRSLPGRFPHLAG